MQTNIIYNEDCFEVMARMEDKSIDAIITDPPYFSIKGDFDFIWKNMDDYLIFVEKLAIEFKRILKQNGSLLWFGDDKNIAYCQIIFDKHFNFLNHLVWDKIHPITMSEKGFRKFATRTERCLFYEHLQYTQENKTGTQKLLDNPELYRPIKDYLLDELEKFRVSKGFETKKEAMKEIDRIIETDRMSYHYFGDYQWALPTEKAYLKMQETGMFRQDYEELRQDYEELRRPFNYQEGLYEIIRQLPVCMLPKEDKHNINNHPTIKPTQLLTKLIEITTKPKAIVFDAFMGSGTTAIACNITDRQYIGCEIDPEYYKIAINRIEKSKTMFD